VATISDGNRTAWRDFYVAALFERDTAKLSERIAQAEWAIVLRARELFYEPPDTVEEEEALDNAMYALNSLRNAHQPDDPSSVQGRMAA
jgi:hypothetical protein